MPDQVQPDDFHYSPHALRLSGRELLVVALLFLLFALLTPWLWKKSETFERSADYRIPYELSNDYWLYQRHLEEAAGNEHSIFVVGDSVVWGEYVTPDGTLSHFLNEEAGGQHHFVNAGLNGLFPLALEGLLADFSAPLAERRIVLHANLLWMTSPQADLSTTKEQAFNHQSLVPQFSPEIPCYRAVFDRRLGHLANRKVSLFAWSKHLQIAYFDQLSIPEWTLEVEHAHKLPPLHLLQSELPAAPAHDPERGTESQRHKPWSDGSRNTQTFPWVSPEDSLQLAAFKRLAVHLRKRGNELIVLLGPLNDHIIAAESLPAFAELRRDLQQWLEEQHIPSYTPATLPSELYGDASHPLTDGYRQLAHELYQLPGFQSWLE